MRERAILELSDDLLDERVVAMTLVGLDRGQRAVGDERVVAVGREQFALLRAVGCESEVPPIPRTVRVGWV